MPNTMDRVLRTPELLESILLHLPLPDLLTTAPRVSRSWHAHILSSPSLQRTLFFRPEGATPDTSNNRTVFHVNPFADLIAIKEHTNRTAAFNHPHASWRRMLVLQPPLPMYVQRSRRHIWFSSARATGEGAGSSSREQRVVTELTFGDVERAMNGAKLHISVEVGGKVYWHTTAFEHEVDRLHWTTV